MTKLQQRYIDLYCIDVAENPDCFKQCVRDNPGKYAAMAIEGLSEHDLLTILKDLQLERVAVAKGLLQPR